MKFNIETLNQYKKDGWLYNQSHPVHPLLIWNYSIKTQYEGFWDEITLNCRALVTDLDGNVIAKGFPKFFNIEENRHIPTDDFEVFEKLDGSLILVFWYKGEMIVASRGSFTSKHVIKAKELFNTGYNRAFEEYARGDGTTTYCFELIGFEQIVVTYPTCRLVMTAAFDKIDNEFEEIEMMFVDTDIEPVKKFDGLDYNNIKQLNWKNSEGFVVRFSNGQRCKIKFEDYIKLHYQMTNLSTTAIWEALKDGKPVSEILTDVPDEFFEKVHEYENEFKNEFRCWEEHCKILFNEFSKNIQSRSLFAEFAKKTNCPSILFAMLDGKDYSKQIWKLIKPEFKKI